MHEVRRTGVIAGRRERLEPIDIELNGVGRYPYLRVIGLERAITGRAAQLAKCFVERASRLVVGLVSPQHADEMLARACALGRSREIHQEGEVLSPQQFGGCGGPTHPHVHRPERANRDHGASSQPSVASRRAALSARARYAGSPAAQSRATTR